MSNAFKKAAVVLGVTAGLGACEGVEYIQSKAEYTPLQHAETMRDIHVASLLEQVAKGRPVETLSEDQQQLLQTGSSAQLERDAYRGLSSEQLAGLRQQFREVRENRGYRAHGYDDVDVTAVLTEGGVAVCNGDKIERPESWVGRTTELQHGDQCPVPRR